jgi:hypothetical protein
MSIPVNRYSRSVVLSLFFSFAQCSPFQSTNFQTPRESSATNNQTLTDHLKTQSRDRSYLPVSRALINAVTLFYRSSSKTASDTGL